MPTVANGVMPMGDEPVGMRYFPESARPSQPRSSSHISSLTLKYGLSKRPTSATKCHCALGNEEGSGVWFFPLSIAVLPGNRAPPGSLPSSYLANARSNQIAYLLKLPPWALLATPRVWLVEVGLLVSPVAMRRPIVNPSCKSIAAPKRARMRARSRSLLTFSWGEKVVPVTSNGGPVLIALKFGNAPVSSFPEG